MQLSNSCQPVKMVRYFYFILVLICIGILNVQVDGVILYTRWGRQTCGTLGELVYTGYIGSSNGAGTGGGANHLCLPLDPEYDNYDSTLYERSRMYGAEYETYGRSDNFPYDLPDEPSIGSRNGVCTVCQVDTASLVLMIPARTTCYSGWNLEYGGYLVSTPYDYYKSEFICMDKSPETASSGGEHETGMQMTTVEGVCGALACPPYESGWEFACVVCTK